MYAWGPCPQMRRWLAGLSARLCSLARGAWGRWLAWVTLRQRRTGARARTALPEHGTHGARGVRPATTMGRPHAA